MLRQVREQDYESLKQAQTKGGARFALRSFLRCGKPDAASDGHPCWHVRHDLSRRCGGVRDTQVCRSGLHRCARACGKALPSLCVVLPPPTRLLAWTPPSCFHVFMPPDEESNGFPRQAQDRHITIRIDEWMETWIGWGAPTERQRRGLARQHCESNDQERGVPAYSSPRTR